MPNTDYCSAIELADYIADDTGRNIDRRQSAVTAASRKVDGWCDRSFWDDGVVSDLDYVVSDYQCVEVDDFSTTTGLVIKTDWGYNGTFATTLTANEYFLEPLNGRSGGLLVPFRRIVGNGNFRYLFPPRTDWYLNPTVRVTARWGWVSVPPAVKEATLIVAASLYKNAPFGVPGPETYGAITNLKDDPQIYGLLAPYMLAPISVA